MQMALSQAAARLLPPSSDRDLPLKGSDRHRFLQRSDASGQSSETLNVHFSEERCNRLAQASTRSILPHKASPCISEIGRAQ